MRASFNIYFKLLKNQWLELISGLTNAICAGALYFMALYFVNVLHFGVATAGTIIGWFGVGSMLGGYLAGWLCDKMLPYKVSIIAMLMNGIFLSLLLLPWLHSFFALSILMMLIGTSNYTFTTSNRLSILSSSFGADKLRAINLRRLVINLGSGVAFVLGGWVAGYGYNLFFALVSVLLILPGLAMWYWSPNERMKLKEKEGSLDARAHPKAAVLMTLVMFLVSLIMVQQRATYGLYLQQYGHFSLLLISHLFALNCILILVLQIPLIGWSMRFHPALLAGAGSVFILWGMGLLAFWVTPCGAIVSSMVWTFGEILFYTTAQVYVYNHAPKAKRARWVGAYQTAYGFANLIGPGIGGYIYEINAPSLWYGAIALGFLTLYLCIWIYRIELPES